MLWKIYFYIYLVLTLLSVVILLPSISSWKFSIYESVIESIFLLIGLYSYIFRKKLFSKKSWQYIFCGILIIWILDTIRSFTNLPILAFLDNYSDWNAQEVFFSIIISIPALVSIYRLGFPKKIK